MELNVLEDSPKKFIAEVKGAGHTMCNALKAELNENKHVKAATYSIAHPLIGIPKIIVETDGEAKPRKLLADAAASIAKDMKDLQKEFKKLK